MLIFVRPEDREAMLKVNVVYVREEAPPEGTEAIEWFLMTNEEVARREASRRVRSAGGLAQRSFRRTSPSKIPRVRLCPA